MFKQPQTETAHNASNNKKKLNREIIRLGLVTGLVTLVLFAWMSNTQAAGLRESVVNSFARGSNYFAAKLGMPSLAFASTISGNVFRDYDGDGVDDGAHEPGVSGVEVRAYDSTGANVTTGGVVTTGSTGNYSITTTNAGTGPYRVEFTLPSALSYLQSGPRGTGSGTTVQFVTGAAITNANLGLVDPAKFAVEANPDTVTTCFVYGEFNGAAANDPALVRVPHDATGHHFTGTTPNGSYLGVKLANTSAIGATYGVAWQGTRNRFYAGAFHKRYSGYGPNGPDAIYVYDRTGAQLGVIDLDTLTGTANVAGADAHDFAQSGGVVYDIGASNASYDGVGKRSLGDLDMSGDQKTLYAMNLFNRRVYAINVASGVPSSSTLINSWATPDATGAGRHRPFALAWHKNKLWIGSVDESSAQAFVHSFDPNPATNPGATFVLQLTVPLGFTRQAFIQAANSSAFASTWRPWVADPLAVPYARTGGNEIGYPQPMLTDLEFDGEAMVLGFRDRFGDQTGSAQRFRSTDAFTTWGTSAGDILRACWTGSAFALEGSGGCATSGGLVNSGPGGATSPEHYNWDIWSINDAWDTTVNNGGFHWEIAQGGLVQVAGKSSVLMTAMDPIDDYSGGYVRLDNATGRREGINADNSTLATVTANGGYTIYESGDYAGTPPASVTYGKANGLGDVEALVAAPPLELGNRVWRDANSNGVQDAGEAVIASVTVRLYRGATLVGTAVTNANGEYYFTSTPGVNDSNTGDNIGQVNDSGNGLLYETAYRIALDNATNYATGNPLNGLFLTANDVAGAALDQRDSDATLPTPGGAIGVGNYPTINLTTGTPGFNNHRYDIGFTTAAAVASCPDNRLQNAGIESGTMTGTLINPFAGGTATIMTNIAANTPTNWIKSTDTTKGNNYWVNSTNAHSGSRYFYTFSSGTTETSDDACNEQTITGLCPNTTYTICAWAADARADSAASGFAVEVQEKNSGGTNSAPFHFTRHTLPDNPAWINDT
ncbi:MAG: hypothetical protein HOP19_26750, partial [Acidobacteria bacterium]|nr:hypothetical protein [Acidobacteriota bacterium]